MAKWNQAKPDSLIDPADYATLDESANSGADNIRSKRQYSTPNQCSAKATRGAVVVAEEDVQSLAKKNKTAAVKAIKSTMNQLMSTSSGPVALPITTSCWTAGSLVPLLFLLLYCLADGVPLLR